MLARDSDVLPVLLTMHAATRSPRILDVTCNQGVMWRGLPYAVTRLDCDRTVGPHLVGDFRALPFRDAAFDVLVFDPPHLPADGHSTTKASWNDAYGLTAARGVGRDGANVSGLFAPFLAEAARVLVPDGIVLAKIADLTHNHRYQWQHVDFINAVRAGGMTACDMVVKGDPQGGHLQSSLWRQIKHLRKSHCYWIVVRNSRHCEAPAVA